MKDSQLFLVVGVLLTIDITIMTTWHLADPFYREVQNLKSYVSIEQNYRRFAWLKSQFLNVHGWLCVFQVNYEKDDTEFIVIPRNENCKSDKMSIFVGVIYAYKGLLLVSTTELLSSFPLLVQLSKVSVLIKYCTGQNGLRPQSWKQSYFPFFLDSRVNCFDIRFNFSVVTISSSTIGV